MSTLENPRPRNVIPGRASIWMPVCFSPAPLVSLLFWGLGALSGDGFRFWLRVKVAVRFGYGFVGSRRAWLWLAVAGVFWGDVWSTEVLSEESEHHRFVPDMKAFLLLMACGTEIRSRPLSLRKHGVLAHWTCITSAISYEGNVC